MNTPAEIVRSYKKDVWPESVVVLLEQIAQELERSNPAPVADLTLRDAILTAMLKALPRDPVKHPDWNALLTNDRLNGLADAVATAVRAVHAAPEVAGAGLDREKLREYLAASMTQLDEGIADYKRHGDREGIADHGGQKHMCRLLLKHLADGKFDAPAPHPTGDGVAGVKEAWAGVARDIFENLPDYCNELSERVDKFGALIEALHGDSDSARLDVEDAAMDDGPYKWEISPHPFWPRDFDSFVTDEDKKALAGAIAAVEMQFDKCEPDEEVTVTIRHNRNYASMAEPAQER